MGRRAGGIGLRRAGTVAAVGPAVVAYVGSDDGSKSADDGERPDCRRGSGDGSGGGWRGRSGGEGLGGRRGGRRGRA